MNELATENTRIDETAWCKYLMEHYPTTAEEIKQFEKDFPDVKYEAIMMMWFRLMGDKAPF